MSRPSSQAGILTRRRDRRAGRPGPVPGAATAIAVVTRCAGCSCFTGTGGFAAMAGDLADAEGVDIPEVPRLSEFIGSVVPGATVPNPLDATGFMSSRPDVVEDIMATYLSAPEFDANIFLSQFAEWDVTGRRGAEAFASGRTRPGRRPATAIIAPLAGTGGRWLEDLRSQYGVAIGNGLRGCLRGLNTMASVHAVAPGRARSAIRRPSRPSPRPAVARSRRRGRTDAAVRSDDGPAGRGWHPGRALSPGARPRRRRRRCHSPARTWSSSPTSRTGPSTARSGSA